MGCADHGAAPAEGAVDAVEMDSGCLEDIQFEIDLDGFDEGPAPVAEDARGVTADGACTPAASDGAPLADSPRSYKAAEPRASQRLLAVLCFCAGLEGIDTMLLRAVFYALQADLGLSLRDLATVTLFQAVSQALSAPLWGVLADRGALDRKTILVTGCLLQGLVTAALAGVNTLVPMILLRSLNGVMLASLRPITNGIIADVTAESQRGRTYGWICASVNLGMVLGSLIAAPLSTRRVLGMQGWRFTHLIVGTVGVAGAAVVAFFMERVERARCTSADDEEGKKKAGALAQEVARVWGYLRMPTFFALVVQGCFGCIPWNALGYQILFFQVAGLGDLEASLLQAFNLCAGAFGNVLGGMIGDGCAHRSRHHGRVVAAQFSVFAGIPIAWFIFKVPAPEQGAFVWYFFLVLALGLTATWTPTSTNLPILSQVVNEGRSAIMAWQAALEGACAAVFGNAAVGFLAEQVFGYALADGDGKGGAISRENTRALGSALMWTSLVPWIFCLGVYSLLHWSYPRDLRRLELKMRAEVREGQASPKDAVHSDGTPCAKVGGKGGEGQPGMPRLVAAAMEAAHRAGQTP